MTAEFAAAFAALRDVLKKQSAGMVVQADTPTEYTLVTRAVLPNKQPMWFGCVRAGKSAVSYHLMPLYFNPGLQAAVPDALRPRKQGKTCFNFKRPDPELFAMLDDLTRRGREHFEKHGFLEAGTLSQERIEAVARAGGADVEAMARRREEVAERRRSKRRTSGVSSRQGTRAKSGSRTRTR